jgi:hypothetical protein
MPPINASVTNQQITASVGETQIDVSVSGGVGPTGTAGAAASVTVGTVTTGAPGSSASVVNAGTSSAAVLNFTIPAGATGAQGQAGATGAQGIQGIQGIQGPAGPAGATGATGPAGSNATATTDASALVSGTLSAARLPGSVVLTTDARLSDARQPLTHQHTASQISDFTSAVIAAAPPTTNASLLTSGTIPDARISSNIARTSDVSSAVAALVNSSPAALDTLGELASALGSDANFSTTVTNSLAAKAPINNPTFTGTVSGVTKAMVGLGNVPNTDATARANHTGTQAWSTIVSTPTTLSGYGITDAVGSSDSRLTNQRVPTDGSVTAGKIAADQAVSFRAITVSGGSFFTGWGIRFVASPMSVENTGGTVLFYLDGTGTVTTGTWQGTAVGVAYGGTGATTASAARTNLGLAIGTDVAAASHTHQASAITDFASAVAAASPEEVVEYTTAASFPSTGNASLLYRASDSSRLYAWVGGQYAEVGPTSVSVSASVTSVAGRTGAVTIAAADVSGLGSLATQSSVAYSSLAGTPSTFAPAAHNQAWSTITGTPTTLSGYGITDAVGSSDARLSDSRAPTSHPHGNITNAGAIGSTSGQIVVTTTGGALTTAASISSSQVSGLGSLATQSGTFSGTSSGTNTGDQTIALFGDVTGSGTGTFAATLSNTGVTAGTFTSVTVDAKGRVTAGSSPAVADSLLRALFIPPAPTSLTATAGNAQVALTWSAPSVVAQAPITDYVVQGSSNSGSTWTTFAGGTSTATSATVTGLTNGTAYVFRVAAVNAVGTGAYTAASSSATPVAFVPTLTKLQDGYGGTFSGSGTAGDPYVSTRYDSTGAADFAVPKFRISAAGTIQVRYTGVDLGDGVGGRFYLLSPLQDYVLSVGGTGSQSGSFSVSGARTFNLYFEQGRLDNLRIWATA